MDELLPLAKLAKEKDKNATLAILEMFFPKIKRSLFQTTFKDREDLFQELVLILIENIQKYDFDKTPGFWEFVEQIKHDKK
ncbi:MAG: helix-turn-helix domain-containing protein [Peptococcaceae bacterium]|nr:helix-turn-helix domain-containing protein [Peptococcaceae bacterium]